MNPLARNLLIALIVAAVGGLGTWAWYATMERVWEAHTSESEAAARNRMLAATMLLRQGARPVTVAGSLGELVLDTLPDGTLILADVSGVMEPEKAARLLAWVARGNTLVAQPRHVSPVESDLLADQTDAVEDAEEEPEEQTEESAAVTSEEKSEDSKDELVETDPIAARLGVRLHTIRFAAHCDPATGDKPCKLNADRKYATPLRKIVVPGTAYALSLDAGRNKLISMPNATKALWSDTEGTTVRVYQEGKGKLVIVAADFFNNVALREHDHAELLLALAALNRTATQVTIVQNLDAIPWAKLLWKNFSKVLIAAAALLALLFWTAVRRFGPVLPQPVMERRSLMEHIDASGAWLWKAKGGRQILLNAAREDTLAVIRRRAPSLFRLAEPDLCAALARMCNLPQEQVAQALHQAPAPTSVHFTRQIRILQELRNHHER